MPEVTEVNADDILGAWIWVPIKGTTLHYGGNLERDGNGFYIMSGNEKIDAEDGMSIYLESMQPENIARLKYPK